MQTNWHRAVLVSLLMIFSSLAGCLETDTDEPTTEEIGTLMASTYHVQQLVKAIVGDEVTVELMSTSNIPVHDYEPTASDIIRLKQSDIFFYHGLGLEPWVDATLSGLGSDAPLSVQTHTLPTGETLLDYESLLIADLCETLDDSEFESVQLANGQSAVMPEIHAESVLHQLTFPVMDDYDDDHDEEGHDEEGHDEEGHDEEGHDEEGHDEEGHDEEGHDEHAHNEPEKVIQNPEGCTSSDTVIAIFHLEEGVHHVEFMSENVTQFNMVTMKMNGGHAHHDHAGHGDEHGDEHGYEHGDEHGVCHDAATHENHDEYETEETCEAAGHLWVEEDGHGDNHGDYCHDAVTHENHDEYETEEACEAAGYMWMEDDHDDSPTPEEALAMADANNDSQISWNEFWVSWNAEDDHDDHDGHDEDGHDDNETHDDDEHSALEEAMDDYMMGMLMTAFNDSDVNDDTFLDIDELTTFIQAIDDMEDTLNAFPTDMLISVFDEDEDGGLSLSEFMEMMEEMEEDDHDDHDGHDAHGEENNVAVLYPDNTSALFDNHQHSMDSGWNLTMDTMEENNIPLDYSVHPDYGTMLTGINGIIAPDDYSWWWSLYLWNETNEAWETSPVGIDSVVIGEDTEHIAWAASNADMTLIPDPEHDEHDGHDDNGGMNETEMMELMFNMFDENSDGMISAAELEEMMEMGDDDHDGHGGQDDHDEHDDHGDKLVGHAVLEVLAEGDYGFAMPADVEFFIVMAEGGHDDHDDHSGHDGHDDHSGHDGHDDHGDEDGDDHGDEANHTDEEEDEALSFDPHSWLDPVAFKEQVKLVLATLVAEYPSMDSKFTDNAEEFMATLDSLDEKFASTFVTGTSCPSNKVASNHNAYSYMAQRYGLEFVTVHGLDPEGEPTAADIIKVVDQINENGITVFFIEEYTSTDAIDSIVQQTISDTMPTGVTVKYLYTMEMAPKDSTDNYASLMGKNFENLKDGLQCTA